MSTPRSQPDDRPATAISPDFLAHTVDLDRFPIHAPDAPGYREVVTRVRAQLDDVGCSVLSGFLRPEAAAELASEGQRLAPRAHHRTIHTNPYSSPDDDSLPPEHPVRIFMERNNAFVAADYIPADSHLMRLYQSPTFRRFVADCLDEEQIYEYADPLAKLVLNVLRPGAQHPWHYDTNEFIVSTLLQPAEAGGEFQYCPGIRSPASENDEQVSAVLRGVDDGPVRRLGLKSGDLQLFYGRYSLHRVTRVEGNGHRITGIFAYAKQPGAIGRVERTQRLFGRVTEAHRAAEATRVRADQLRD